MRPPAPPPDAGVVGGAAGGDDLVPGRAVPGREPRPAERPGATPTPVDAVDRETVLHVYTVETLYAAVVDAYVDWHTAIVQAVVRASLSGDKAVHFRGHERCVSALAALLQFTNAYRQGRGWSCECRFCLFMGGLRNYLAHHWATDDERFAVSGGTWRHGSVWTRQHNATPDANRVFFRSYAPRVSVGVVSRALTRRRKEFDGAARRLGGGADRVSLAPAVDGYAACLSADCAAWRTSHPVPEPDGLEHGYPRTALLERAAEMRRASAGSRPGTLGLVATAWD